MKNQNGNALVAVLVTVGIIGVIVGTLVMTYFKYANMGVDYEKAISYQYEQNENILATHSQKIMEMAQVPTMYKDDVKEVYTAAIQGRYGADGSQAMMQWLKEQNPQLDPALYNRLQQVMEAGRNKFENGQAILLDKTRAYDTAISKPWSGFWLSFAGKPSNGFNLDDYDIISSGHAQDVFESGVDNGVQINR